MSDRQTWQARYAAVEAMDRDQLPCRVLQEYAYLLPKQGRAADLACGLAANGVFLARRGLQVEAWDFAEAVLEKVAAYAQRQQLDLVTRLCDLERQSPQAQTYDVLVVSRYLSRPLLPALVNALRPGGLLYYQTFTTNKIKAMGPRNPAFLLQSNELLHAFPGLTVVAYHEDARVGDIQQGWRNEAAMVAQKPEN